MSPAGGYVGYSAGAVAYLRPDGVRQEPVLVAGGNGAVPSICGGESFAVGNGGGRGMAGAGR
jgi:hypothetical protein